MPLTTMIYHCMPRVVLPAVSSRSWYILLLFIPDVCIYGFIRVDASVYHGTQAGLNVVVDSNMELRVTTPAQTFAADKTVDVVIQRIRTAVDRDTGYGSFTFKPSLPKGDAKDQLAKLTKAAPATGAAQTLQPTTDYAISRNGHGSAAGPLGVVIVSLKVNYKYNSPGILQARFNDGNPATGRPHLGWLSYTLKQNKSCILH